jgi:FkbM family methyltransferase
MIRTLIERLSRGSAFRRRLPVEFGSRPLYLSGDSALQYLKPRWAKASKSLLNVAARYSKNASAVWDIGANCGVFALAAAHVAGPGSEVVAVEPDPFLAALLQRTIVERGNGDRLIHILCAAICNTEGIARFMIANRGRSSNALEETGHRSQARGTRYVQHVPTTTLDNLLEYFRQPDLIKVDVEGAEVLVLQGAVEVLEKIRPKIYIEVGQTQAEEATRIFRAHHYRIYDADHDLTRPIDMCAFNTLAIPAEQSDLVPKR